jgi:hypothetical protein
MSERASSFDPSSEPRPHLRPRPSRPVDPELRDLAERALRVPDGLALLMGAPLECAAILLGVAPPVIERSRVTLEAPGLLEEIVASLAHGAAGRRAAPTAPPRPPAPRDPEQLIAAARQRSDGLRLLLSGAPEAAAIAFGVHPDLVQGARDVAARRAALRRN